jgi:hypothetical protein
MAKRSKTNTRGPKKGRSQDVITMTRYFSKKGTLG